MGITLRSKNMRILIAIVALLVSFNALAQTGPYDALRLASTDQERVIAHQELADYMAIQLDSCETKEDVMGLLKDWPYGSASAGSNKDWAIVITWNSESEAREQSYGGFVIFNYDKSDAGWDWVELEHNSREDIHDDGRSYRPNSWAGALYYTMVLNYDGKTPVYTLLGWDGADGLVTRKVIETMSVNNGRVRIGLPYIERDNGLKKRHVLEYGDIIQVTLKYEEDSERIILDRLAPNDPSLKGQTAFYGPTLEYDQYEWKDSKWVMESFVDVKNEGKRKDRKPYNDPRPKSRRK